MSTLYQLRSAIRDLLLEGGLWQADEVLIKRRSDLWNNVAVATGNSEFGQCIVVGVAKGTPARNQSARSQQLLMEITIPITLIELPNVDPDENSAEDDRWEATVMRLMGSPLGRSETHYELAFDGFEEVSDEQYVIRQTTFKTNALLKK